MGKTPRMTIPTQLVLRALLEDPTREMYGLEICQAAGLAPGTIHPILARFEGLGWLESHFEDIDPRKAGRPRRRYYRVTQHGAEQARLSMGQARIKVGDLLSFPVKPARGNA
ncbi:PadR family transcriptional regulator [[Actinomadura] parvosata]|uniref:PadR family transcriptional regulator n=1 Tax=[Actinomadura] parvosata TaxID=1955412 RepID=UPI001E3111D5|nr:helix-turn-helix transcriptional regulator [Nonomuraea sp. ATCC 55076]